SNRGDDGSLRRSKLTEPSNRTDTVRPHLNDGVSKSRKEPLPNLSGNSHRGIHSLLRPEGGTKSNVQHLPQHVLHARLPETAGDADGKGLHPLNKLPSILNESLLNPGLKWPKSTNGEHRKEWRELRDEYPRDKERKYRCIDTKDYPHK